MTPPPDDILRYVDLSAADARAAAFSAAEREVLDTINERVGARESLESVIDFLADATRPFSPCDRFSVAFLEAPGGRVVSHYTRAFYEPIVLRKGYAEDLTGSSLQQVIIRGTPRIIGDLQRYLELHPKSRSTNALVHEGVRSSLTCPLRVDGRNVGLLFRSSRRPRAYDDHQVLLHLAVASRLSQAVEKTCRIEQLAEANRAYFEMLGFVTHELKSPIGSMMTEAGLLVDGYVGDITPDQRDRLEKLIRKGRYLLDLITDYLDLSRLEGGAMQLAPVRGLDFVHAVLDPAIELVMPQLEARGMRLVRDVPADLPPVEVDPSLIKIVVVNLLSNAIKYGYEAGEVRVRVARSAQGPLGVWVRNTGVGFPESERTRLFRRFSRLQTPELLAHKGTGVGLYTSWRIIQLHGGRMDAQSVPNEWAEFSFEVPQPLALTQT